MFPQDLTSGDRQLMLVPSRILVVFRARPSKNVLNAKIQHYKLIFDDGGVGATPPPTPLPITRTPQYFFLRTKDGSAIPAATLNAMQADRTFSMVAPVYQLATIAGVRGLVAALSDGFALHLGAATPENTPVLRRVLAELGLKPHPHRANVGAFAFLQTPDAAANGAHALGPRAIQLLARFQPQVVYEILPLVSGMSTVEPTDTLYRTSPAASDIEQTGKQWDMKRLGGRYAWQNNVGVAGVRAYVIDEGIQQDHIDFAQARAAGRVSQRNVDTGTTDAATLAPLNDHGTAVAGIMVSGHDDVGPQSVAGHAPGTTLVSIRGGTSTTIAPLTNFIIAQGIGHAGGSGVPSVVCVGIAAGNASFVDPMVQTALTSNPDVLVCVATGNFSSTADSSINYVSGGGTLTPNLMICGATQQGTAVPSTPTVSTGDDVWKDFGGGLNLGSRHGPETTVVAPGDGLITLTTSSGYVVGTSQGTSLSAAHVAGLALLVRSKEGATFSADATRQKIIRTASKSSDRHYSTQSGAAPIVTGLWNEFMGYGRIDASAVLVHDVDVDGADLERADVYIRSFPTDNGARPIPGGTNFWSSGDVIISTNAALVPTGPLSVNAGADAAFTAARDAAGSTDIPAPLPGRITTAPVYIFVRVINLGPAAVRGIKVTAVTCACATGWVYPDNWDHITDTIHVAAVDESPTTSYFTGPLAVGDGYIARLLIPTGSDYSMFSNAHACCLTRVTAANDIGYSRVTYAGGGAQPQFNNIMQRNLNIV